MEQFRYVSVNLSILSLLFRRLCLCTLITCISGPNCHNEKNVEAKPDCLCFKNFLLCSNPMTKFENYLFLIVLFSPH